MVGLQAPVHAGGVRQRLLAMRNRGKERLVAEKSRLYAEVGPLCIQRIASVSARST